MTTETVAAPDILVVEDDDAIRSILREILEDEGYRVQEAMDGQAALDYLTHAAASPCLILLDLMMPTMTGWEFRATQRQHRALRDIPVMILSALGDRLDSDERTALSAVGYLAKPIDWNRLTSVVKQWCPAPGQGI